MANKEEQVTVSGWQRGLKWLRHSHFTLLVPPLALSAFFALSITLLQPAQFKQTAVASAPCASAGLLTQQTKLNRLAFATQPSLSITQESVPTATATATALNPIGTPPGPASSLQTSQQLTSSGQSSVSPAAISNDAVPTLIHNVTSQISGLAPSL